MAGEGGLGGCGGARRPRRAEREGGEGGGGGSAATAEGITPLEAAEIDTPVGPLALVATGTGLCRVHFGPEWPVIEKELERRFGRIVLERRRDPAGAVSALRA